MQTVYGFGDGVGVVVAMILIVMNVIGGNTIIQYSKFFFCLISSNFLSVIH